MTPATLDPIGLRCFAAALALGAFVTLSACGSATDDDGHEGAGGAGGGAPTAEEEACEHLADGPSSAVTAAAEPSAAAPAVANDHQRFDVTLVDVEGGKGGAVTFAVGEAADYVVFLSADVPLVVADASGAPVAVESTEAGSELCPGAIAVSHTFPLTVGLHTLTFGPTTESTVRLVLEEAVHAGDTH